MRKKAQQKLEELRAHPEHVRLRVATILAIGASVILAIITLAVLVPLQLYVKPTTSFTPQTAQEAAPQVGGITTFGVDR